MSGRTKGKRGEREAIAVLRAAGFDARGVRREAGAAPDVDVVVIPDRFQAGNAWGWWVLQVKREERAPAAWFGDLRPGVGLMCRRNRRAWEVWAIFDRAIGPERLTVEGFATYCGVRW